MKAGFKIGNVVRYGGSPMTVLKVEYNRKYAQYFYLVQYIYGSVHAKIWESERNLIKHK